MSVNGQGHTKRLRAEERIRTIVVKKKTVLNMNKYCFDVINDAKAGRDMASTAPLLALDINWRKKGLRSFEYFYSIYCDQNLYLRNVSVCAFVCEQFILLHGFYLSHSVHNLFNIATFVRLAVMFFFHCLFNGTISRG